MQQPNVQEVPGCGQGLFSSADYGPDATIFSEIPLFESSDFADVDSPSGKNRWNNKMAWSLLECVLGKQQADKISSSYCSQTSFFLRPPSWEVADSLVLARLSTEYKMGPERLKQLYVRIATNSIASVERISRFSGRDDAGRPVMFEMHSPAKLGLFPLLSKLNHSCAPTCKWVVPSEPGEPLLLQALDELKLGEELTVGYVSRGDASSADVSDILQRQFGFTCRCQLCALMGPVGHLKL
jgi:hypothetical protein